MPVPHAAGPYSVDMGVRGAPPGAPTGQLGDGLKVGGNARGFEAVFVGGPPWKTEFEGTLV